VHAPADGVKAGRLGKRSKNGLTMDTKTKGKGVCEKGERANRGIDPSDPPIWQGWLELSTSRVVRDMHITVTSEGI